MIRAIRTVDAHVAGEPLRLIVEGVPRTRGQTMLEKRDWLRARHDRVRRALMHEPRGHRDMYGAVLTEPVAPDSQAGVLFMHHEGYSTMCGHGIVGVVTIALERGLLTLPPGVSELTLDTPAGSVRARPKVGAAPGQHYSSARGAPPPRAYALRATAFGLAAPRTTPSGRGVVAPGPQLFSRARGAPPPNADAPRLRASHRLKAADAAAAGASPAPNPRVLSVSFTNVPSFVLRAGLAIQVGKRSLTVDVAFGGAFYGIVDSEAAGVPLRAERLSELRRLAREIKAAVEKALPVVHPAEPALKTIYGIIFTGTPNTSQAHLRNVTVFADGQVDRSPCGTGTAAVMAVLDAMGLLHEGQDFVHESLIETTFVGRAVGRTMVGDLPAIIPELEGSAWITGEHTFLVDDDDPLKDGFTLGE